MKQLLTQMDFHFIKNVKDHFFYFFMLSASKSKFLAISQILVSDHTFDQLACDATHKHRYNKGF